LHKTGGAPTILESSTMHRERVRRSFGGTLVIALLVVGAMAATTGYLIKRSANRKTTGERHNTAQRSSDAGVKASKSADAPAAVVNVTVADAAAPGVAVTPPVDDAGVAAPPDAFVRVDEFGLPIIGDPDEDEIKIDPENVEDPDPEQDKPVAQDEDDDAPKTAEEAEKRESAPADKLATNLHDAVLLIKAGKKSLAIASITQIWKKNKKSAYAPFLLGNLYFDRKWWSVAMDHYRAAIRANAGYKRNPVLNRNIIRMMASTKTRQKAVNFIRGVIGRWAAPHLRWAARNDPNPVVRKQAASLARYVR
jgi:hypothetical protein